MENDILLSPIPLPTFIQTLKDIVSNEVKKAFSSNPESLISIDKACKVFDPKISKPTLRRWTKSGMIKSYRIESRVYYKHSEVIEAAKELKVYKNKAQ